MERNLLQEQAAARKNAVIDFWVTLCIVCRLGFPGILAESYGILTPLIDYGSCFLQLLLILFASADTVEDIRLIDLKGKYTLIYGMLAALVAQSLLVTSSVSAQVTTCVRFVITALFGLWLADHYEVRRLLEILCAAQAIFVAMNLVIYFGFRGIGFYYDEEGRYLFHGLMNRKNTLGEELAYGLVLQIALFQLKKRARESFTLFQVFGMMVQIFLLVITQATGALFTAAVPIAYLWFREKTEKHFPRLHWGYIYIAASVGFLVVALTILPIFAPLLESLGKDATLSNRTYMWEEIIPFMLEDHTFTGYGMFMFWNNKQALKSLQDRFSRDSWFRSMSFGSHNTLLEMWLDIGLNGLAMYFIVILYSFRRTKRFTEEQYLTCSAMILPLMIRGLTERSYTNAGYLTLFFFILIGVGCNGGARNTLRYPGRPFYPEAESTEGR